MTEVDILKRLADIIESRKAADLNVSYVARLFHQGDDAILKKIGEEATEVVLAAKDARVQHNHQALISEMADLWFHCLLALAHFDIRPEAVLAELTRREGLSGLEEKAMRKRLDREQQNQVPHS